MKRKLQILIPVLLMILLAACTSKHVCKPMEWITETEPSCEEPGLAKRFCKECGNVVEERIIPPTGHLPSKRQTVKKATCQESGLEVIRCQLCNEIIEQKEIPAIDHVLDEYCQCTLCYSYFWGEYPQTRVSDETLLADLNAAISVMPLEGRARWAGWESIPCYNGSNIMWVQDIEYEGARYRAVFMSEYPSVNICYSKKSLMYADSFDVNTLYWYKWEPIEWRFLIKNEEELYLMSAQALDAVFFQTEVYPQYIHTADIVVQKWFTRNNGAPEGTLASNYFYSSVRQWLNGPFLKKAFSVDEQERILRIPVENNKKAFGASYISEMNQDNPERYFGPTGYDNVFLPSYHELQEQAEKRQLDYCQKKRPTDYAVIMGANPFSTEAILRTSETNGEENGADDSILKDLVGIKPVIVIEQRGS